MEDDRLEELWARGDALDLEALTPEEQRAFRAAIATGELGKDVEVWTPWWCQGGISMQNNPFVIVEGEGEEVGEALAAPGDEPEKERSGQVDFASLYQASQHEKAKAVKMTATSTSPSSSNSSSPSPFLKYHLLDLLFAYVAVLRTYNGCWNVAPEETAEDLLALSPVLQQQQQQQQQQREEEEQQQQLRLESAAGALASSLTALRQWKGAYVTTTPSTHSSSSSISSPFSSFSTSSSTSLAMGLALAQDVTLLLAHRVKIQAALLDARRMVQAALAEVLMEEREIKQLKQQQRQQQQQQGREKEEEDEIRLLTTMVEALSRADGKKGGSKRRKERRHAGKRLLRLWHKLRFFFHWACRDEEEREEELRALRIEFARALHEHQEVVASCTITKEI
jgi:uncharacterized membrane protein YkoI